LPYCVGIVVKFQSSTAFNQTVAEVILAGVDNEETPLGIMMIEVMDDIPLDSLHDGLRGKSITDHIITTFIVTCENATNLACSNFWFDSFHNFFPSLLPCNWKVSMVVLSKNHFLDGLVA
jgi:hypothetical protein